MKDIQKDTRNYGFSTVPMWDNLGVILDAPPSSIEEAMKLGGMDWEVLEKPSMYLDHKDETRLSPGVKALVRSDNGEQLSIQNLSWNVVQNKRAFQVLEPMIKSGELILETGVCLNGGRQIALTARIANMIGDVVKDDAVEAYLVLYNVHGGPKVSFGLQYTNIRAVCTNTLAMIIREGKGTKFEGSSMAVSAKTMKFRHTDSIHENLDMVQDLMLLRKRSFDESLNEYRIMAEISMTASKVIEVYSKVFQIDEKDVLGHTHYETIINEFDSGLGADIRKNRDTAWTFYNAITKYNSHLRSGRGESESDKARSRFNSLYFGASADMNTRAHEAVLSLAA